MTKGFAVTYERFLPHAADEDVCEADEIGYVLDKATLREALAECDDVPGWAIASEADEYPIRAPRAFYFHDYNDGSADYFRDGVTETRALHVPDQVTPASRRRIARLLRLKVCQ